MWPESRLQLPRSSDVIWNLFISFVTIFWDDITIFWDENLLWFLTEKKKCFGRIRSLFTCIIFIPKYCNIIPKYRIKGHEQVFSHTDNQIPPHIRILFVCILKYWWSLTFCNQIVHILNWSKVSTRDFEIAGLLRKMGLLHLLNCIKWLTTEWIYLG